MNFRNLVFSLCLTACSWQWFALLAQETPKPTPDGSSKSQQKEATPEELRDGELAISGRYARFERMLSQMADVLGRQDPERADLLRRAIGKGREDQVKENIEKTVELLNKGELGTASETQSEVVTSLEKLLKLLQSEDRRSSVERERERLNELLKEVRNVLVEQKSARAVTLNSEAPSTAAPSQQRALNETEKLLEAMHDHDVQEAKTGQGEGKDEEGPTNKGDADKSEKLDEEPKSGKSKHGQKEGKDSQSPDDQPREGKSRDGESKEGKEGKSSPNARKSGKKKTGDRESKPTPGREELEKAQEQMEQALEELKQQEREKALESEDQAIEELHDAAAKLEEMLKQLREEEKEMLLASLEARFQRMLILETQIYEDTVSLAATPQKDWLDQYYGQCRELAELQSELTMECSQTVNLLREDGTSVSILLAVEDIESDMGSVSGWLEESKVSQLTQSVQTDIIESLKQLIETTQKEMQEMKEQQQTQEKQQNSEQKPGLVELMAEIRMLRNLQLQVNRRTKQVDGLLQSASTDDIPALKKQVHDLSVRQRRLIESAQELAKQIK